MRINETAAILSIATIFAGCGNPQSAVNAFTVYDNRTMSCQTAREITTQISDREREYRSTLRAAKSKLDWCDVAADGGAFITVGYFDTSAKIYEFKRISAEDDSQVRRLCLDIAVANSVADTPPANLAFKVQTTIGGEIETLPCDRFAEVILDRGVTVLVAPAHLPLLVDIDPVLVLATGANPQLEGVPHRFYDEVRSVLEGVLSDLGI